MSRNFITDLHKIANVVQYTSGLKQGTREVCSPLVAPYRDRRSCSHVGEFGKWQLEDRDIVYK
jgi:hypothetical protein